MQGLQCVLSSPTYVFDRPVSFELEVPLARFKQWEGDFVGYLDTRCAIVWRREVMADIRNGAKPNFSLQGGGVPHLLLDAAHAGSIRAR